MSVLKKVFRYLIPEGISNNLKKFFYKKYPHKNQLSEKPTKKRWKSYYASYCVNEKIEENWVLYEAHAGIGMVCNPAAIFKAFTNAPEFSKYIHIWVINEKSEIELLQQEYKSYKNVIFVRFNSRRYAYFLAKSKILINNTSFNPVFSKRDGQVFVNTWHSVTVKSLGYDTPNGGYIINNMLRAMLQADYIISPNRFMTKIYDDSFRLRDIYKGVYIEEGYPRNDLTLSTNRDEIIGKLERRGTHIDRNKKIILYAPTWNGNNANKPIVDTSKFNEFFAYLSKNIDMDEYQILIKPHHVVYRRLTDEERESGRYVSYAIDANELLSIVDILVTDYSSIYFDYLISEKPILFFIPDYEQYSKIRGIYFKLDELPGPCSFDLEDLAKNINNINAVKESYKACIADTKKWACEFDNGKVSDKVLDVVLRSSENYNLVKAKNTGKKTVLMHLGGLKTNGVTTAALSLLKTIDYDKYDITVFVTQLKTADQKSNFDKIPSQVRTIVRVSPPTFYGDTKELYKEGILNGVALPSESLDRFKMFMKKEYERIFGNNEFDYVIDFFGYSVYFTTLALIGGYNKKAKKFIWQHNDLKLDLNNAEKRELNNSSSELKSLVQNYSLYDYIVSATKALRDVNAKKLSDANDEKYIHVTNMLDIERFNELRKDTNVEVNDNEIKYLIAQNSASVKQYISIKFDKKKINFVTMGRCMPEKNHKNLIKAIKKLVDDGVNCALYIIGDGHLKEELQNLSENLGIEDRVVITGFLQNPLAILQLCDCFVFPSLYEGQGLAVLEARIAKLPIIVGNYETVSSVLYEDKQFILNGTDENAICEGLRAYIEGKIPNDYEFDVEKYNKVGKEEFDEILKK